MHNSQLSIFACILSALFCAQMQANVITGVAEIPTGYYNGVSGKKGADNILNALNEAIKSHTVLNYGALEDYYERTDFYGDTLWDMYSTCRFTMDEANKSQKYVCDGWNKEHLVCQSWFSGEGMKSDLFNVYPTDARVNNIRSSYAYGEVSGNWGTGISNNRGHALGKVGSNTFSGYSGTVFEPYDDYKGDFARSFMYMAACYRNGTLNGAAGSAMFTSNPSNLTTYAKNLLLQWHRNDPVSEKEVDRNQAVYGEQKNRNPFIDYPELAEYIWGDKVGQTVDLSSMIPTCESVYNFTKHGITWMVNGEVLRIDSVRENNKPSELPLPPTSCSQTSESFYCWCGAYWTGTLPDYLPADAITIFTPSDVPAVTNDVTYHAVFAHKDTQQTGVVESSETLDFSAQNYNNGTKVSSLKVGNVTVTFNKGTGSTDPAYYTTGTAVRCYPKNTMTVTAKDITKIEFTFGSGDSSNPITANTGTFNGSTWTGSADEVTFTIGGDSKHRRIQALNVTMNGEGSVTNYYDFITTCGGTQAIDEIVNPQSSNRKLLIDGHLYIQVGEHRYTITGQRVH